MLDAGPTDTPALQEATIEALWQEHQQMVELEEWARVLETGEDIILRDPSYRRTELDDHLFRAFMGLARESIAADRPEEALRYLDRALSIVPQSPEAVHLQNLTSLYLDGMRFYGADWPSAIDRLAALYAVDPNYKDAADRLLSAYISYAQQLETESKWCEAAAQYGRAMEISSDSPLVALRQNAEEECTLVGGTATPEGPTEIPSGSYAGRELQPEAIGSDKMSIHGHVFDSSGEPVAGARVEIKAWDFTAYAVTDGSGQFSFDGLANAAPYTLTLVDLTSLPIQVETEWGRLSWVVFEQAQ